MRFYGSIVFRPATCSASESEDSPLRGALGAGDLQQVVVVLQLEVGEHQGYGVSRLGQHRPGAVCVVVVLGRVVGCRDGAALTPQGPAATVVRCGWQREGKRFRAVGGLVGKKKQTKVIVDSQLQGGKTRLGKNGKSVAL